MQLISCHDGKLRTLDAWDTDPATDCGFTTGLPALDALLPHGVLARGAVHEVLASEGGAMFFALVLARCAAGIEAEEDSIENGQLKIEKCKLNASPQSKIKNQKSKISSALIWCDPTGQLYPPAIAAAGIPLERLYLLHPKTLAEQTWAIAECLRCKGVGATVAQVGHLSRLEARRLQLAAERGGGIGVLLRPWGAISSNYAAATRWLVEPARGERTVQRWKVQLIHGHGGLLGHSLYLEYDRDDKQLRATSDQSHLMYPAAELAHRPGPTRARASA